jgi:metal-dependent amidase/aminoacylase/carboxypeptidase family protein
MQDLKKIRTTLHQNPELSGNEVKTSEFIFNYLNELNPDSIGKDICGNGIRI